VIPSLNFKMRDVLGFCSAGHKLSVDLGNGWLQGYDLACPSVKVKVH